MNARLHRLLVLIPVFLAISTFPQAEKTALVGGTLLDVSDYGNSRKDLPDAVIIMDGGKFASIGKRKDINIPSGARIIDINGKFILPGLIDGFAALDNQSFANAYLYMGVTSIIGVSGGRRHSLFESANPGPRIIPFAAVGRVPSETSEALNDLENLSKLGTRVVLLMYGLKPEQLRLVITKAHELGLGTIGELGSTSYAEAVDAGIDAFVHSSRYALDLAPAEMRKAVAANPFGPPARQYSHWLAGIPLKDLDLENYAKQIARSRVALIPTLSLYAIGLPENGNPWQFPIAQIIDAGDLHMPVDKSTGKHSWPSQDRDEELRLGLRILEIEKEYVRAGARYLAGSGTDVLGTMPGISLHQELAFLTRIGLSPRQALAAATSNFSRHLGLKEIGGIREGGLADLIVLDKNPTEDIGNLQKIAMVFQNGRMIDREKLRESGERGGGKG